MKVFTIIISLFSSLVVFSQNSVPIRNVLYTLKKNEILNYNEYYVSHKLEKNRFAAVVTDTISKEEHFIFNGEVIFSNTDIGSRYGAKSVIMDFDLTNPKGYCYKFKEGNKWMVNIGGKIEGPFEEVYNERFQITDENRYGAQKNINGCYGDDYDKVPLKFDFCYRLGENWFSYTNGQIELIESPSDINASGYGSSWSKVINNKFHYDKIGGIKISPPIVADSSIKDIDSRGEDVACIFVKNGKKYFYFNGTISEAFDNDSEWNYIQLTERGYIYTLRKEKKEFINFNGKLYNAFDGIEHYYPGRPTIIKNNGVSYCYKNNKKLYFFIDGKTFGPYDEILYNSLIIHENGKFAFLYRNGKECFANINGQASEARNNMFSLSFFADGSYRYYFQKKDGWIYENNNSLISKTENRRTQQPWSGTEVGRNLFDSSIDNYEIKSNNNKHILITDIKYDYVIVDGRSFGTAPAIKAWYDETKNSFIWNSWEGKELVIYELKLD
jgi:hypothetical protein